jgi:hypothetical protein
LVQWLPFTYFFTQSSPGSTVCERVAFSAPRTDEIDSADRQTDTARTPKAGRCIEISRRHPMSDAR